MKFALFLLGALFAVESTLAFANSALDQNRSCADAAIRNKLFPHGFTPVPLDSGEVLMVSSAGENVFITRGKQMKSDPLSNLRINFSDDGNVQTTRTSGGSAAEYFGSGFARYLQSGKAARAAIDEIKSSCSTAPAFKKEYEQVLAFPVNRKAFDHAGTAR